MAPDPLTNVFWRSLSGPHAGMALHRGGARRYRAGYSPIAAFADPGHPELDNLAAISEPGEFFFVAGWNGPQTSPDWQTEVDTTMVAMAWDGGPVPAPIALPVRPLGADDLPAVMALVDQTRPGPFGPHTLSMGAFIGHFDPDGHLLAMAGERTRADEWHEVSGICTDPAQQGRGLGRAMTLEVVRRQLLRGEVPYLHVLASNETARGMYRRLGFRERLETPLRVIRRLSPTSAGSA